MERDPFDELIRRYMENELNEDERELIESWLNSIESNSPKVTWSNADKKHIKKIIKLRAGIRVKPRPLWKRLTAVASVLLVLSMLGDLWYNLQRPTHQSTEMIAGPIVPGQNKAILYQKGNEKIELDELQLDSVYQVGNVLLTRIAENEIRIIPQEGGESELQTIEAPKGGNFIIELIDGSRLLLNANSYVVFPTSFSLDERKVETHGEVFFEIEKDKLGRPFVVKAGESDIKVLGTKFNVHYIAGEYLRTSLFEGKVKVSNPKFDVDLTPGMELSLNKDGHYSVSRFVTEQVDAWKRGYFSLDNKDIVQIMDEIGNWYNVEVSYIDVDIDVKYQGSVSKFEDIKTVLDILSLAKGNTFEIEGRRIMVK